MMNKKSNRIMIIASLTPSVLLYLAVYLYPTLRTLMMSFFNTKTISSPISQWNYIGFENYARLFESELFLASLWNLAKIWSIGGIITFLFAFLFAIILHAGARGKEFWRAVIYLPNIISAVAMANMWNLYVYNTKYGLLANLFTKLGLDGLAAVQWTSPDNIFMAMLVAFCFGCVGYYLLILLSGLERIPNDFYEASRIEGAGVAKQFFTISLPLLRPIIVTCLTFWSIWVLGFFIWTRLFSAHNNDINTITPVVYMYTYAFGEGGASGAGSINAINGGMAATVGVVLCVITILLFLLINLLNRGERYEY